MRFKKIEFKSRESNFIATELIFSPFKILILETGDSLSFVSLRVIEGETIVIHKVSLYCVGKI